MRLLLTLSFFLSLNAYGKSQENAEALPRFLIATGNEFSGLEKKDSELINKYICDSVRKSIFYQMPNALKKELTKKAGRTPVHAENSILFDPCLSLDSRGYSPLLEEARTRYRSEVRIMENQWPTPSIYFEVIKKSDGSLKISVENWQKSGELLWEKASWTLRKYTTQELKYTFKDRKFSRLKELIKSETTLEDYYSLGNNNQKVAFQKLTQHILKFIFCPECVKGELMTAIAQVDPTNELKGLTQDQAWELYDSSPKKKEYLRAALSVALAVAVPSGFYVGSGGIKEDVDWPKVKDALSARFVTGDAYRFDNNDPTTNVGHAWAGAIYNRLCRANNLEVWECFLYTFTASAVWEYFTELPEVMSVNDMVVTPIGGVAIGEVLHQFGQFFLNSKESENSGLTYLNKVMRSVFGSPEIFYAWWDGSGLPKLGDHDRKGLSTIPWRNFFMELGVGTFSVDGGKSSDQAVVNIEGELINIPEYGRPGAVNKKWVFDGAYSELKLRSAFNANFNDKPGEWEQFLFYVKTSIVGYYTQNIKLKKSGDIVDHYTFVVAEDQKIIEALGGKKGDVILTPEQIRDNPKYLDGHSFFVGMTTGFSNQSHTVGDLNDWMMIVNVFGPTLDLTMYKNNVKVRMVLDMYPTFAGIRSMAFQKFKRENQDSIEGNRDLLLRHGYYWAFGFSTQARVVVSYKDIELETAAIYRALNSFDENWDRFGDKANQSGDLRDQVLDLRAKITVPSYIWDDLKLSLIVQRLQRTGSFKSVAGERFDRSSAWGLYLMLHLIW